uniref:Protein-tyrosine-phosphatase n=1 Tax=Mesocestoides corti TaxID=53468 RepID=A0A5K3EXG5_MESCO
MRTTSGAVLCLFFALSTPIYRSLGLSEHPPTTQVSKVVGVRVQGSRFAVLPATDGSLGSTKAKRHTEESLDPSSPRNLVVFPTYFGSLNISWEPPTSTLLLRGYEVILRNLTYLDEVRKRRCSAYDRIDEESAVFTRETHHRKHHYAFVDMIPDTFYSVEVHALLANGTRSPPTILPSSPLVPASPPSGSPSEIYVSVLDGHSAEVTWSLPGDIECNGKIMGFIIELNSTYETSQLMTADAKQHNHSLTELMPGTDYTLRMLASSRGGLGQWSQPVHFRTKGEAQVIDMEAFVTTSDPFQGGLDDEKEINYRVPDKIIDFHGQGLKNAIKLSWTVKWRRLRRITTSFEHSRGWADDSDNEASVLDIAPNVMFRLIWRADDTEPAEEVISGGFKSYTLKGLRAGTTYHFRIIAIIPGGDGPSAYTVARPKHRHQDVVDPSRRYPIPVNLSAHRITSTEATLRWDLPNDYLAERKLQKSNRRDIWGFQVRYYPTTSSDYVFGGDGSTEFDAISVSPVLVNVTGTDATSVVLKNLQPETVYEFSVRAMSPLYDAEGASDAWSMVQGFETLGQQPESPPQNITVSSVMTNYLGDLLDSTVNPTASILITWKGTTSPRGFYHIYLTPDVFTTNRRQWSQHTVSGQQNSTVLHNLRTNQPYFLIMSAHNRHGTSSPSPVFAFKTAGVDGSGFINLNLPGEHYEVHNMSPAKLQRLIGEQEALLKIRKTTDVGRALTSMSTDATNDGGPNYWIMVSAALAVLIAIIVIIAITIGLTRRCTRGQPDRVKDDFFSESPRGRTEKAELNSPMTQTSHDSHSAGLSKFGDSRFLPLGNAIGLIGAPAGFDAVNNYPYTQLPPVSNYGGTQFGNCGGPGSIHSQPALMQTPGRGGSESDCRTTPIDSDLESAKSANLVTYPYHAYHHHQLNPRQRGTGSPPVGTTDRLLPLGHAGLIGPSDIREVGGDSEPSSYRNFPTSLSGGAGVRGCSPTHLPYPIALPPKMENLTNGALSVFHRSPEGLAAKSPGRLLPYRELGRLDTSALAEPEASRSTAGSSGYDSAAPTTGQSSTSDKALGESSVGRARVDATPFAHETVPRKFTPTRSSEDKSDFDCSRYQNHTSIKLSSINKVSPIPLVSALEDRSLSRVYSTEELSQEMANLEGLMKNLTAITQKDFDCASEL